MTATRAFPVGLALLLAACNAFGWDDLRDPDMPWLGGGGRAHFYSKESSCFMCPTGYTVKRRWGRSGGSGADPYETVGTAMGFLAGTALWRDAPHAAGEGDVGGAGGPGGVLSPRALPYRFTVVMIEPTVIVMNFDLGALVHEGEPPAEHSLGTPYLGAPVAYGTRVPATGTLLWFSPELAIAPTPVAAQAGGHAVIEAGKARLELTRDGGDWIVKR